MKRRRSIECDEDMTYPNMPDCNANEWQTKQTSSREKHPIQASCRQDMRAFV